MLGNDNHATSGAHVSLAAGATILNGKYSIVQQAGTGNFARVFEAVNTATRERVAIKVLKKGYERDADFECDVLRGVAKHDLSDAHGMVRLLERGTWNGHALMVFTLKGAPLRSSRFPLSEASTKEVMRDIASTLAFLHFTVRAVHTDLKPENILAEPAGSARKWCVCDLGSASFYREDKPDTDLITTRPYRAPEVVLQRGWCHPSDAWSLGCILYEMKTGRKLFDCHNDQDHVKMMESKLGPIPAHLKTTRAAMTLLGRSSSSSSLYGLASNGKESQLLSYQFRQEPHFLSLLLGLLDYDASKRLRCDAVAHHPYLTSQAEADPLRTRSTSDDNVQRLADQFRSSSFRVGSSRDDQENHPVAAIPKFLPLSGRPQVPPPITKSVLPPHSGRSSNGVMMMDIEMQEKPQFPRSLSGSGANPNGHNGLSSWPSSQNVTPSNSLPSSPRLTSPAFPVASSNAYGAFHARSTGFNNRY